MSVCSLTKEGKQRFGWIRDNMSTESTGYQVLEYLYDSGSGTAESIANLTRLPLGDVMNSLEAFKYEGLVVEAL